MKKEEAIKILKDFHDKSALFSVKTALDTVFPELAESEDERIRKALIDYLDDANKADENPLQSYGIHIDKAIDWLEKQDKQESKWTDEDGYNLQCCIAKAERDIANGCIGRNKELIEWLKSLEERIKQL